MLQANYQSDPIVEILRLAYRRGLAIQREEEAKSKAVNPQPLQSAVLAVERKQEPEIEYVAPHFHQRRPLQRMRVPCN